MATLFFTPRTTIDANVFQDRLDNSPFHGEWNIRTGAYEFEEFNIRRIISKETHQGWHWSHAEIKTFFTLEVLSFEYL